MSVRAGILAGGRSSRFGSDKAFAELDGQTLIGRMLDALRPQVDAICVAVREATPRWRALGVPLVRDAVADAGPLQGVQALLQSCRETWLLLLPCDALWIPADWARQMQASAVAQSRPLVLAEHAGQPQPTFALLHCSLLASVEAALAQGERALYRWMLPLEPARCELPVLHNINTPADLAALSQQSRA